MKNTRISAFAVGMFLLLAISCQKEQFNSSATATTSQADKASQRALAMRSQAKQQLTSPGAKSVTAYTTGLYNPRGLEFGPDGDLYVAEGGPGGGSISTGCAQVVFPVGPYFGQPTGGRISRIDANHVRHTVTDQLPTSSANEIIGGDVGGVADVAFVGNTLYALLAGGGCSHGVPQVPNGIVKVNSNGSWNMIANLSAWLMAHPAAQPDEDDFEPDGTWYSMINVNGALYALEPNHGELVKVTTNGAISRVADISASQGHIVPTALAYRGNFFFGNLDVFPIPGGASNIYKVNPAGQVKVWQTGLNTVLGLVIDETSNMYVLEMSAAPGFPTPGLGKIVKIDPAGRVSTVVDGLSLPTGLTMGPDHNLYVSNLGFGPGSTAGGGTIMKIEL